MSKGIAIIYDRASTTKQDQNYTRHDVKRIGVEIATRYGYDTEEEPRVEVKSGEELRNRPVMMSILTDIQNGKAATPGQKITAIIVPNFTRLSRDEDIIDGLVIKKICRDNGVVVIDFNGKIYNFQNDNDQDAAFLEFWFAARDKRQMMSNMMRGMKEKAMHGSYMGGFAPLGYRIVSSGQVNKRGVTLKKREKDPEEARLIRRIFKLYFDNSAHVVASILNSEGLTLPIKNHKGVKEKNHGRKSRPFSSADIIRIVRNSLYAGWVKWNTGYHTQRPKSKYLADMEPQIHFDQSLQIISQEDFDRAQRIRLQRKRAPSRVTASSYPFTYILKCLKCGGPLAGGKYYWKGKSYPRHHYYRCPNHYDNLKLCPDGENVSAYPVAYAIIPFVVQLLQDKTQLIASLKKAAQEYTSGSTLEKVEAETCAEVERASQGIKRLTDLIADGTISNDEAREKIKELHEKKERLTRDLQRFQEDKAIKGEILEVIEYIQGNLDSVLWNLLENKPKILARILRLIFKPHSVSVKTYWDKSVPGFSYAPGKRKGRIVDYALQDEFAGLIDSGSSTNNTNVDGTPPVNQP